jgi:hypothetical protein
VHFKKWVLVFLIGYGKGEKEVYFMSLFAMWKLSNLNSSLKKKPNFMRFWWSFINGFWLYRLDRV